MGVCESGDDLARRLGALDEDTSSPLPISIFSLEKDLYHHLYYQRMQRITPLIFRALVLQSALDLDPFRSGSILFRDGGRSPNRCQNAGVLMY